MYYSASQSRYEKMVYNRCGRSGLKLPAISLGLWQNFGHRDAMDNMLAMSKTAFDLGITHFDLANNYGPPAGSAEDNFCYILDRSLRKYRDQLIISTKAGYDMWEGPYGDKNGSRKYLTASLDQSLKRMKLDYVDIYYHHVPDSDTPVEETMLALDNAVRQGKALYVGISNYNSEQTRAALKILKELKTPFVLNQAAYSIFNRFVENDKLIDLAKSEGFGIIAYSPLAQGLLTDKYFKGIPDDSRIGKGNGRWIVGALTPETVEKSKKLSEIAKQREQTLSQMALSWVLRDSKAVPSVIIGASKPRHIIENVEAITKTNFSQEELLAIDNILRG